MVILQMFLKSSGCPLGLSIFDMQVQYIVQYSILTSIADPSNNAEQSQINALMPNLLGLNLRQAG